jgi:DNA-binding HxlR family transcriptional regulator
MSSTANPRSYRQFCGIAKALDVVGERWTLLILRDLLLGPRRFADLRNGLPGITPNLLAARLKALAARGVIVRAPQAPPAGGFAYELTPDGRGLEPALLALGKWGWRFMSKPAKEDMLNMGWALIALKRRFVGCPVPLTVELRTPERVFQYRLTADYPDVREGTPWIADFTVAGRFEDFRALFFGGDTPERLVARGALALSGETRRWPDFLSAFGFAGTATAGTHKPRSAQRKGRTALPH